ncbi:MAG: cytidylate kinase family protein [Treponema sp.]|jgi:cytidylate kinase|nr:cytidylate kinase family protein [Treponema sp.]
MDKKLKIAVSGKSGCGNTTVSRIVAEKLHLAFINFTFRSLAAEKHISLKEVLDRAAKDDWWDREVDIRQLALARQAEGCVLGSRLAIWMLEEADLKVYLRARPETRAARIVKREGGDSGETTAFTLERDRQDRERYIKLYGIDNDDYGFAGLILDTDSMDPEEIAHAIIRKANQRI